ncbi:putative endo-polygalacturonase [Helianthus anomalus]
MRGMGFHLIFASIFSLTTIHRCLGAQNMSLCNEAERLSLFKFKESVYDESGMLSSWVGSDCCQWSGVHCDAATGSVVSLRLTGQNIWNNYYFPESNPADEDSSTENEDNYPVGQDCYLISKELDSSLAELRNLTYLDLSGNDFGKSPIPEFIGSLKWLSYLNLSNAGFSGIIPSHIGNLSKLEILDLSARNQYLWADDMAWVFSLSLLKHLNLSGVDLIRAQNIDMVLYMIPSLVELSLSRCSLNNARLGPYLNLSRLLPNIQYLDLSKNFFQGPF